LKRIKEGARAKESAGMGRKAQNTIMGWEEKGIREMLIKSNKKKQT